MTRALISRCSAALLLLLAATALRAEQPQGPQAYAVVVGIGNYADKDILPRPHAEDDAKAFYDVFTNKEYLGIAPDHIRLLLGSGSEEKGHKSQLASKENILKALTWLKDSAGQDDLVLFVFIGEAGTLTDQGERLCYFAVDSTVKDRAKTSITATEMAAEMDKLKSQKFCTFLDVNFRGFEVDGKPAPEAVFGEKNIFQEFLSTEGKDHPGAAPGRVLFVSSVGKHPSPDLDKHGMFSEVLLAGLKGAADQEGYEPDGYVTVDELSKYFGKQIAEQLREHFKGEDEKRPDPGVFGGTATHYVLTTNPAALPTAKKHLVKFEQVARDQKLDPKYVEEGHTLLSRMPKLEAFRNLRKAYQQLADGKITTKEFEDQRQDIFSKLKIKRTDSNHFASIVMEGAKRLERDYVKEEKLAQLVDWAVRGMYRRLEEKIPSDIQDELGKSKDMTEKELFDVLVKVRDRFGVREDLADHKDIDIALQRMTSHLDPYTTYIDPKTADALERDVSGEFMGVGIQIRKDLDRDMLKVISPLRGSPAYRAKILAGDIISQVTNFVDKDSGKPLATPQTISTKGMPINDAVAKILGPKGTQVKLTIEREGEEKPLDFTLTREPINVESVIGFERKSDDSWDYMIDPKSKIAYMRLTSFQKNSFTDMAKVVKDLNSQKVKGLILDLRNNPGGLLGSAVSISDMFIDDGTIVEIRKRDGEKDRFRAQVKGRKNYLDFPMVCMVNGNSASGSEIVSACLQDHARAIILGERSYGKGSVQNIDKFDDGLLKMTNATFWRPSGKNLNKASTSGKDDEDWGVRPNPGYDVKTTHAEQDALLEHQIDSLVIPRRDRPAKNTKPEFKDRQLDKALEYLRDQIKIAGRTSDDKGT